MPQKKLGARVPKERLRKFREAYIRYIDPNVIPEERPTQVELAHELEVPQRTLSYWFTRFAQEEGGSPEFAGGEDIDETAQGGAEKGRRGHKTQRQKVAVRKTAGAAIQHLADRSTKTAEQAIIIGDIVMSGYGDLIKISVAKGMNLENFIKEVFNFYEQKAQLTQYITNLEGQLTALQALSDPNWRYQQKSNLLYKFARDLLQSKALGIKVNPKKAIRAFQIELEKIDTQEMVA